MARIQSDIRSSVEAEKKKALAAVKLKIKRARDRINKRMKNLAAKGLEDTPAYQTWLKEGPRFMVRGKTPAQLEMLALRLDEIDKLKTANVKGAIGYLEDVAKTLRLEKTDYKSISKMASNIFRLEAKVRELLETEEELGAAFGYAQIWDAVTEVAQLQNVDLASSLVDLDAMVNEVKKALVIDELPMFITNGWTEL